jgi:hypothetical protein
LDVLTVVIIYKFDKKVGLIEKNKFGKKCDRLCQVAVDW